MKKFLLSAEEKEKISNKYADHVMFKPLKATMLHFRPQLSKELCSVENIFVFMCAIIDDVKEYSSKAHDKLQYIYDEVWSDIMDDVDSDVSTTEVSLMTDLTICSVLMFYLNSDKPDAIQLSRILYEQLFKKENCYQDILKEYTSSVKSFGAQHFKDFVCSYQTNSIFISDEIEDLLHPITNSLKEEKEKIKRAITNLMEEKRTDGKFLMHYQSQWIGIYRILVDYKGWNDDYNTFSSQINSLGPWRVKCTPDSLQKANEDIFSKPFSEWDKSGTKIKSATYDERYQVAEFMMKQLDLSLDD